MKTNIKMRVTPEQSKQVQKIVFANGGYWSVSLLQEELYLSAPFLYLELLEYCTEDEMKKENILIYGEEEELFLKTDGYEEVNADLFIRTNGTCVETEENKMEWIPYDRQELEFEKDYLVTDRLGEISIIQFSQSTEWKILEIEAYAELPKPYEKPKSLKERLEEAVEKYCYEFSDEEWKNDDIGKFYIVYKNRDCGFYVEVRWGINNFSPYTFETEKNAQFFINSFTTDELVKIMKGEIK